MYPLKMQTDRMSSEYLRGLLVSDGFTAYAIEASARSRMPKLNREQLFAFEFELPPIAEQRVIAARLDVQLETVGEAREAAEAQLAEIERLPDRLLAQAFENVDE